MTKWKTIRVKQELLVAVKRTIETRKYKSLSDFVSEAIQLHLRELKQKEEIDETQDDFKVIEERTLCSTKHIWAMVTPKGNIRIGLSDFARTRLKVITNIKIEPLGSEVCNDKAFGFVETWMFKFDLYAPVSGKIVKINRDVQAKPDMVKNDFYELGWIAEIKPNDIVTLEEELRDLMGPKQYKMWAVKQHYLTRTKS